MGVARMVGVHSMDLVNTNEMRLAGDVVRLALVDPDPSVRDAVAGAISMLGFSITSATGTLGEVGMEVWERVDVILVDWAAFKAVAWQEWIRKWNDDSRACLVLMSVNRDAAMVAEELSLGGFIEKPMSFPAAIERLGELVRRRSMERKQRLGAC